MEGAAVVFTLFQHGDPGKPRLLPLQTQHFKQFARIGGRHAPFMIVIGQIQRIGGDPAAALVSHTKFLFLYIFTAIIALNGVSGKSLIILLSAALT